MGVTKRPRVTAPTITFTAEDESLIHYPHSDPIVISAVIGNHRVHRILVDTGSSADIIYLRALEKMGLGGVTLKPFATSLVGFSGEQISPEGIVSLAITLCEHPTTATVLSDFIVVKGSSPYNALLGRPTLNAVKAIVSPYHLSLKFPAEDEEVGVSLGNQHDARVCYSEVLRVTGK